MTILFSGPIKTTLRRVARIVASCPTVFVELRFRSLIINNSNYRWIDGSKKVPQPIRSRGSFFVKTCTRPRDRQKKSTNTFRIQPTRFIFKNAGPMLCSQTYNAFFTPTRFRIARVETDFMASTRLRVALCVHPKNVKQSTRTVVLSVYRRTEIDFRQVNDVILIVRFSFGARRRASLNPVEKSKFLQSQHVGRFADTFSRHS